MLQFNTGKKLEKVFPPDQFEALIDYFQDYGSMAATKSDVRESELRLQLEIEKVRAETEKVRAELTEKMEANKHEILKWMMGMMVAQTTLILAALGIGIALIK